MSENIIDVDDFLGRVQGDKELLLELLDIFQKDFEPKVKELKEAVANNDPDSVEHVAHFLKGSCGNISAGPLRMIFHELETAGKQRNLDGVRDRLSTIDEKYGELKASIKEIRSTLR